MDNGGLDFRESLRINRFSILLGTDDQRITSAVSDLIDKDISHVHYSNPSPSECTLAIDFLTHYASGDPPEIPGISPNGRFEDISFYSVDGRTLIDIGGSSTVVVDIAQGKAWSFVGEKHISSPWILSHRIFYLPFLELLGSRNAFHLHAGCVSRNGKGILISGGSGKGKSTLTYSLSRSGFSYISDDAVFLQESGNGLEAFAFPEKIKLSNKSRSFFSEFDGFSDMEGKIEIPLADTGIVEVSASCSPKVIIIPSISGNGKCIIEPIPAIEAMVGIVRQSVLLTGKSNIQEHMEILQKLCEGSESYRVTMGSDIQETVDLIEETIGAL